MKLGAKEKNKKKKERKTEEEKDYSREFGLSFFLAGKRDERESRCKIEPSLLPYLVYSCKPLRNTVEKKKEKKKRLLELMGNFKDTHPYTYRFTYVILGHTFLSHILFGTD